MDIKGFANGGYDPQGRNIGQVKFIHGGVGRNVAENLAELDTAVTFVSTVDDDGNGQAILDRLRQHSINVEYVGKVADGGMGMWLAILDQNGDLAGSISKLPDFSHLEQVVAKCGEAAIAAASHVVVEIDLNERVTRRVLAAAKAHGKPSFGIIGNLEVARRHKELLGDMACFICNDIEAGKLFDNAVDVSDSEAVKKELPVFCRRYNIKAMIVTLGDRGAVYYEQGAAAQFAPVVKVKMVDSTGAGDAFFAGAVSALAGGCTLAAAVERGTAVAAYTIQSSESTCVGFRQQKSAAVAR